MKFILLMLILLSTITMSYARSVQENYLVHNFAKSHSAFDEHLKQREFSLTLVLLPEFGNELKLTINEEDSSLNAYATFDDQSRPVIIVNRGLLNHEKMTKELLDLFLCHEMGHISGGEPKLVRRNGKESWSSVEGQADYYATQVCMDFLGYTEEQTLRQSILFTALIASLKGHSELPKIETPERFEVARTLQTHPSPQCRLDTLIAGLRNRARPHCWFKAMEQD